MNPLKDNFVEDNKEYVNNLLNGKLITSLVPCNRCGSAFLIEKGSKEYEHSYCPFCGNKAEDGSSIVKGKSNQEIISEVNTNILEYRSDEVLDDSLSNKTKRILLNTVNEKFNVCACTECNNRFIFLDEDKNNVAICAFCGEGIDKLKWIVDYSSDIKSADTIEGLAGSLGKLFFVRTDSGVNENLLLTDIDYGLSRYRFVSVHDDRIAFWIKDSEIIDMFEFIKVQTPDINSNED